MPAETTLVQLFEAARNATKAGLHVSLPGRVESYDPATQTANIKPTVRNPITDPETGNQDSEELPTIPNVMVIFPRGGGFHCSFPLVKGDDVVLVFSELSTGQYRASGEISEPLDTRRHSLGYPFAIPGAFPFAKTLLDPTVYVGKMVVGKDGDPTASIRMGGGHVDCGGVAPLPLATAVGTTVALDAIALFLGALVTALNAPGATVATVGTAMSPAAIGTLATALGTTAHGAVPTLVTRGQ